MNKDIAKLQGLDRLDETECWTLLRATDMGRLAVSIRNHPDIFPVNYAVVDETIIINTAPGTKLAAAVLGTAIAFEADVLDPITQTGWSVVLKGQAHEVLELEELFEAEALDIDTWTDTDKSRYLRLTPDSVTGRRI
jgi:nitroimidazol reductase NimA-like FMN-containing flavoprotein (pyridoxamine 5'-phosphate oxidase superfamily)